MQELRERIDTLHLILTINTYSRNILCAIQLIWTTLKKRVKFSRFKCNSPLTCTKLLDILFHKEWLTIEKKFKLTDSLSVLVINPPTDFPVTSQKEAPFDRVLAFVYSVEGMVKTVQQFVQADTLQEGAYIFLMYPKKGNKQFDTYIGRDDIFPAFQVDDEKYVLGSAIKFTSLQSLDETYSILALKKQTKKAKKIKTSQRVDDYVEHISKIEAYLTSYDEVLIQFQALTPGYKKTWARYIYSAKKEETQQQRLAEMKELLKQGYKTKEHYRKANQ